MVVVSQAHPEKNSTAQGEVAIIGMACVFPKAPDLRTYWQNIVSKVDAIGDPPKDSLTSLVYDPDSTANNRIYCQRGGYLDELQPFNPADYGIMPVAVDGAEPEHFMALQVATAALADAGFPERPFNREKTEVILGRGTFVNRGYISLLQHGLILDQTMRLLKELHPEQSPEELAAIEATLKAKLPPFSPEQAPGLAHNVMAGIIANRLDLKGSSLILDAACASSLIALEIGMGNLLSGKCDVVLTGGVQISTAAPIHMLFTQLGALSRLPQLRPFDKDADGTMLGEGIGMMVLKRREDAERDGHRIYAIVRGVGSSSDGRGKGLLAPQVGGEELALRRAYAAAGVSPGTIGLVEAHGTALPLGDATEIEALRRVFGPRDGDSPRCALGTVKSMIGHLIPAAGIAGIIKTALSLYHKILPPTLHCENPDPKLEIEQTPFYLNTETRPWIHGAADIPRRAGVSAFGFGGINTHAVLEEYRSDGDHEINFFHNQWETELVVLQGESREHLIGRCEELYDYLSGADQAALLDVAYSTNRQLDDRPYRLSIVAGSTEDLSKKLAYAIKRLQDPQRQQIKDRGGVYFFENPLARQGKLAFLFPGEGSQYVNMLHDLCQHFTEVRSCFDLLDRAFVDHPRNCLPSSRIFPPTAQELADAETRIWQMDFAVDAVTAANRALFKLISLLGVQPHAILGHSSGELMALEAAGAIELSSEDELVRLTRAGNRMIEELSAADGIPEGNLVAVGGVDRDTVLEAIKKSKEFLCLAMDNCPHQFVICGTPASAAEAVAQFRNQGGICQTLSFGRAYHTPLFEPVLGPMREFFHKTRIVPPRLPMYSCMTAGPYPQDPEEIRHYAVGQWARPVRFRETIEAMYEDGFRLFLEVGPRGNLTGFVNDILQGKPYVAVATNLRKRAGTTQLNHSLGILAAHGVPMQLEGLYKHRSAQIVEMTPGAASSASRKPIRGFMLALNLPTLDLDNQDVSKIKQLAKKFEHSAASQPYPAGDLTPGAATQKIPLWEAGLPAEKPETEHLLEPGLHWRAAASVPFPEGDESKDVMTEYFRAMENFLETQERIMQAYLGSGDFTAAEDSRHQVADMPVPPQAHRGRILDAAKDSEAVISETQDRQVTPAAAAEIASPPAGGNTTESDARIMLTGENLAQFFLACISDKTGYPLEMLSLDQDLEADLGIDSIKRLEILGGIIQHIGSLDSGAMEQLTSLKTTGEIVAVLAQELDRAASRAASGMTGEQFQDLPEAPPDPRPAIGEYPFLLFHGKVTQIIPGEKVVVERRLDLKEDLFLQHHTLGGKVSQSDADLLALPLVPFSVSLEMMAETAAHLFPGKLLVAMSVIKTHNWIAVEDQQLTLEIVAEARPGKPEEIGVQLKIVQNEGAQKAPAQLAVEGTMIFGDAYPTAPPAGAFHPGVKSPPCLSPDQFYPCALFHGPLFQSVSRLQSCGDKGAEAVLQVPPNHQILRGVSNPPFLTDPVLLDGAGQVVGLWAASNLDKNFVIFPVGLEEVRFYSPSPETSLPAICRVLSALQESANICSDIELLREDGAVVAQLKGLQHKRAQLAPIIHEFRGSREVMLSTPWQAPLAPLTSADTVSCCRLAGNNLNFEGADGRIWRNVVAYIVLNRRERETWARLSGPERRRTEWLLARVAGKEAVRRLLKMRHGVAVWSADIEIQADEHGKPLVLGDWVNRTGKAPSLSLSHSRGTAAALAAESANGLQVGIDLEALAPPKTGYERLAFDSEEFALLSQLGLAESAEWRLRLWCAKEAAAKALGRGLLGGPRNLIARHMDKESGRVSLAISGSLLREFPHFAGRTLEAYTLVQNEFIFATAFCHKGD